MSRSIRSTEARNERMELDCAIQNRAKQGGQKQNTARAGRRGGCAIAEKRRCGDQWTTLKAGKVSRTASVATWALLTLSARQRLTLLLLFLLVARSASHSRRRRVSGRAQARNIAPKARPPAPRSGVSTRAEAWARGFIASPGRSEGFKANFPPPHSRRLRLV